MVKAKLKMKASSVKFVTKDEEKEILKSMGKTVTEK